MKTRTTEIQTLQKGSISPTLSVSPGMFIIDYQLLPISMKMFLIKLAESQIQNKIFLVAINFYLLIAL